MELQRIGKMLPSWNLRLKICQVSLCPPGYQTAVRSTGTGYQAAVRSTATRYQAAVRSTATRYQAAVRSTATRRIDAQYRINLTVYKHRNPEEIRHFYKNKTW